MKSYVAVGVGNEVKMMDHLVNKVDFQVALEDALCDVPGCGYGGYPSLEELEADMHNDYALYMAPGTSEEFDIYEVLLDVRIQKTDKIIKCEGPDVRKEEDLLKSAITCCGGSNSIGFVYNDIRAPQVECARCGRRGPRGLDTKMAVDSWNDMIR